VRTVRHDSAMIRPRPFGLSQFRADYFSEMTVERDSPARRAVAGKELATNADYSQRANTLSCRAIH